MGKELIELLNKKKITMFVGGYDKNPDLMLVMFRDIESAHVNSYVHSLREFENDICMNEWLMECLGNFEECLKRRLGE